MAGLGYGEQYLPLQNRKGAARQQKGKRREAVGEFRNAGEMRVNWAVLFSLWDGSAQTASRGILCHGSWPCLDADINAPPWCSWWKQFFQKPIKYIRELEL